VHAWCTCSPFAGQITDLRARVSELEAGKGGEARELSDRLNAAVDDAAAKAAALRTALADTAEARRELEAARAEVTEMNAGTWCVCVLVYLFHGLGYPFSRGCAAYGKQ
jgi:hypothetical protein